MSGEGGENVLPMLMPLAIMAMNRTMEPYSQLVNVDVLQNCESRVSLFPVVSLTFHYINNNTLQYY